MSTRKLRWGVLGAAKIAIEKVIPAMQRSERSEIVAIASRSQEKADAAAKKLGIATAYGSYEALLADPAVDAIYNPLPNQLHVPWSIAALQAGKHVLCEKPIALSSAEANQLVEAGARYPQLKLMEAFMYRFHPQWITTRTLARDGQVGELRTISTVFSYFNRNADDIRNRADCGGGGLMDIGCYPVSLSRFIFGREPERVLAHVEYDPEFGVDRLAAVVMDFGQGQTSTFTCSTQMAPHQRVNIFGATGSIEIEIPFNAPPNRPCRLWQTTAAGREEKQFPVCDQYALQGDAFAAAVLENRPVPTPIVDAVANMRVLEAIVRAGKQGSWQSLQA